MDPAVRVGRPTIPKLPDWGYPFVYFGPWHLVNRVILPYSEAMGVRGKYHEGVPTLEAANFILTAHGADKILVPAPSSGLRSRVTVARNALPSEVRARIQVVDQSGAVWRRVQRFVEPIDYDDLDWPESMLAGTAEGFLYHVSLGAQYGSSAIDDGLESLWEFLAISDPFQFDAEGRARLAEIARVALAYGPYQGPLMLPARVSNEAGLAHVLEDLLADSEFRHVVRSRGLLGLSRHPNVVLRKVVSIGRRFVERPEAGKLLRLSGAMVKAADSPFPSNILRELARVLSRGQSFAPPVWHDSRLDAAIYRYALMTKAGEVVADPQIAYGFEEARGEHAVHVWRRREEADKVRARTSADVAAAQASREKAILNLRNFGNPEE